MILGKLRGRLSLPNPDWPRALQLLDGFAHHGPLSDDLLGRLGLPDPLPFMRHGRAAVAGVACRILRLSFTGERSYELYHQAGDSVRLWQSLMEAGRGLGVRPHGLEALEELRLDKGHILVGVDSLSDSTPRRLGHGWAVRMDKGDFIGRRAVARSSRIPLDKLLVGMEMEGRPPPPGAILRSGGDYAGFVTSSAWSRALARTVLLAWIHAAEGGFPEEVQIDGRAACRVPLPFYDPEPARARS